jgi:hypothetical protein
MKLQLTAGKPAVKSRKRLSGEQSYYTKILVSKQTFKQTEVHLIYLIHNMVDLISKV